MNVFIAIVMAFLFAVTISITPTAYAAGASVILLLSVRFLMVALASFAFTAQTANALSQSDLKWMGIIGVILVIQTYAYMTAVALLPLTVVVILFYTFPIITFIIFSIVESRRLHLLPMALLSLALLGVYWVVEGSLYVNNISGVFWGFTAAVMMSLVNIISHKINHCNSWQIVKITALLPAFVFTIAYLLAFETVPQAALLWSLAAAVSFCLAYYLFFYVIAKIGAVRVANILYCEPIFVVLIAMVLLDEMLTFSQWLGIAIIVSAVMTLEVRNYKQRSLALK